MKSLVIGSGAREHAIVKAMAFPFREDPLSKTSNISQTNDASKMPKQEVFAWPGSDAIFEIATPLGSLKNNQPSARELKDLGIELVVVGPEAPLVDGWADDFRRQGLLVFGPCQAGATLEGSKIFAKEFMSKAGLPTAPYRVVQNHNDVLASAQHFQPPYVLKADGLAAGKGVYICQNKKELEKASFQVFEQKRFGNMPALMEAYQDGWEMSYLILTNGYDFEALPVVQDHKPLKDGNVGPNTGGMGAIGPLQLPDGLKETIESQIVKPSVVGLQKQAIDYLGVLYIGLIMTKDGPKVLEYNVRFGDPEAQVILPLLDGDWIDVFHSIAQGQMPHLQWKNAFVNVVVMAANGYPQSPQKGHPIDGIPAKPEENKQKHQYLLHAGTKKQVKGGWVTNGGRVLNAVGLGKTSKEAIKQSYQLIEKIHFEGMQYRTDIGQRLL